MVFADSTTFGQSATYSDKLRDETHGRSLPPATMLIAALFVLCLIPRLWLACKLTSVCDDGYYYIFVANSLQDGDFTDAFEYLNLNVYPAILLFLNKLGFDWVVAGKLWGALIASLLVLPMFGWVRRMFDDRVAAMACFLYGVHPHLIEICVEPIREATFWFLFTLCLYLLWRAVSENRLWLFASAGITLAITVHTRVEGWVLLVPLAWWSLHRLRSAATAGERLRLIAGGICCLAATPLLLLAVNITLLREHSKWEFGRISHFAMVASWLNLADSTDQESSPAAAPAQIASTETTQSVTQRTALAEPAERKRNGDQVQPSETRPGRLACARIYFKDISRALGPVWLILSAIGLWNWRSLLLQRDKSALAIVGSLLLLAVWIRLEMAGNINSRYFLVLALVAAPFQALGCFDAIRWISGLQRWRLWYRQPEFAAAVGLLSALLLAGWIDGLMAHHKERDAQLALGEFLHATSPSGMSIVADLGAARASYPINEVLPLMIWPDELFITRFSDDPPDMVIFSRDYLPVEREPAVVERGRELGLERVDTASLPHTETPFLVMRRNQPRKRVAGFSPETGSAVR